MKDDKQLKKKQSEKIRKLRVRKTGRIKEIVEVQNSRSEKNIKRQYKKVQKKIKTSIKNSKRTEKAMRK